MRSTVMISADEALSGRSEAIVINPINAVLGTSMLEAPTGARVVYLGMGCFWGAERVFWQQAGVISTAVGYGGGYTPNPSYEEVCTSNTGHTELVKVIYDPTQVTLEALLALFWEKHDPTQAMRQGNDIGTQYRSAIFLESDADAVLANGTKSAYQQALNAKGLGAIATEIAVQVPFYFAEDYHQQYLHKNPAGYCGIGGTGVVCPI
ncbi:peptide-methionine (S)-S-oxide reductase MsrA [Umboniibacter marinipuniceus]|uniref:Peptide methionine sulfoxide reductase MsrA n=1 Tax=Umboniibacter marinipuniceus TaxID=569599 RepID=A0A3M0A214_9GAMM|nr:peptide-methionine (S)-S-oxide reductase MsrA [Umboniibacter marinipuniceus]RMA78860.1 peptide-methionine (S)-S-oxide reductase [Umboniibacter marinipuniceus]